MRGVFVVVALSAALAGCASSQATAPTPTARPTAVKHKATATPTVKLSAAYSAFVRGLCSAFRAGNGAAIRGSLMYYQYNSGLRWGMLGDGEGHTSDPSLIDSWLAGSHVRCTSITPGVAGHGTLLTVGWSKPAAASLLDLDLINGHWKINDFTFAGEQVLAQAMQVGHPILPYHA